jgi:hypothetical protein
MRRDDLMKSSEAVLLGGCVLLLLTLIVALATALTHPSALP